MGSLYKRQLNEFVSGLEIDADVVLDWGGAQSPIKGRTKEWNVAFYRIVDLDVPHSNSPKPDIAQDANQPLSGDILEYLGKTDVLIALGLMDYVINPNVALDSMARLLTDGGYAWVEWPLFYCHHNPIEDEGCRYSEGCVKRLVAQAGLTIETMIRKPAGNGHLVQFFREDGQRMSRDYPYHDTVGFITKLRK